ncbi:hypothetical protein D3C77_732140 [compost metagenome]
MPGAKPGDDQAFIAQPGHLLEQQGVSSQAGLQQRYTLIETPRLWQGLARPHRLQVARVPLHNQTLAAEVR